MSYKNDSELVIINSYAKAGSYAKAELYETYDRLRDLTVSGPSLGGSGMGKFGSVLMNFARIFGAAPFIPTFGSEAVNIPGTSYYMPITGGTGVTNGGQAAFGLAPFAQTSGFPTGAAAPIDGSSVAPLSAFSSLGIGSSSNWFSGIGDANFPSQGMIGALGSDGGMIVGGAAPVTAVASGAAAVGGLAPGAGFGKNWVMPAAGIVSGIGGLLTTLGPFFGPFGIAAAAGGSVLNGVSGAILNSYQAVSQRILNNADNILTEKIKNLETTVKQLDAQQDIIKKLLKESVDADKKLLDNI
ncbi:MAG: hypothetical protein VKJ04_06090 [Vampirovibrionales bacterium]|nr:hypothetical protein [Vampirovibrionales bacterium]